MEEIQYVRNLIEITDSYAIDRFRDINFEMSFAAFEGIPKKHPSDTKVLVLFTSPFSTERTFYEFPVDSIGRIEELGTITSSNGVSAYTIRVWVKKGMHALRATSFIIE